jgi:transposase InsO family protein
VTFKPRPYDRIIDSLENMFSRHGLPYTIRSDNGPQFTSKVFEQYVNDNDVKHRKTTPLHPAANGEVERQNRSLMKRIRIAQAESLDWKKVFSSVPYETTWNNWYFTV